MLKLTNPLHYPTAVLIGGITLVVGVRFLSAPSTIILPSSVALTTLSAAWLKSREPDPQKIAKKQLENQLEEVKQLSQSLALKAQNLRQEAKQVLTQEAFKLDWLIAVENICDRVLELPTKVEQLGQKIVNSDSLLSVEELQQKLTQVNQQLSESSQFARQHLSQLSASLERNIELAKAGKDTRQAQIVSLHNSIQRSAGILQQLQNELRKTDLEGSEETQELNRLNDELNAIQENLEIY